MFNKILITHDVITAWVCFRLRPWSRAPVASSFQSGVLACDWRWLPERAAAGSQSWQVSVASAAVATSSLVGSARPKPARLAGWSPSSRWRSCWGAGDLALNEMGDKRYLAVSIRDFFTKQLGIKLLAGRRSRLNDNRSVRRRRRSLERLILNGVVQRKENLIVGVRKLLRSCLKKNASIRKKYVRVVLRCVDKLIKASTYTLKASRLRVSVPLSSVLSRLASVALSRSSSNFRSWFNVNDKRSFPGWLSIV